MDTLIARLDKELARFPPKAQAAWTFDNPDTSAHACLREARAALAAQQHTGREHPVGGEPEQVATQYERAERLEAQLREAEARSQAAQQQLVYWWHETGRCPCGARRESPTTHQHVGGCPTDAALRAGGGRQADE